MGDDRAPDGFGSDEQILERVRDGDREAFEILVRRYHRTVYRAAHAVARDDAEAEEIAQEAWVRAFDHLDQYAGRGRFVTWVNRIAVREAWLRGRRGRRTTSLPPRTTVEISSASDPERSAAAREMLDVLDAAIGALPENFRTVFLLREIEGLSTAETARLLKTSLLAVKTRLYRARLLLRGELLARLGPRIGS